MTLLRSFPAMVLAMVLLSIGALCAAQQNLQLLLVAGTLAAISWYVTEGPRGRILPKWVSNLLVIGVSLNVIVDFLQHRGDPLGVLGRFAVWLTLIKLYERRTARDHAQLMLLSLLLMITGCLNAPADLLFGAALLVYCALGLYVLLLYQLHAAFERSRHERLAMIPQGYRLIPPLKPTVGRRAGLHFRSQSVSIGIIGSLLSIVLFLSVPRGVGEDLLGGISARNRDRRTQFVNQIDLVTGNRINDLHVHVFSAQLTDQSGRPIRLDQPLLLRGGVCDRYDGQGSWRAAKDRSRPPIEVAAHQTVPLNPRLAEDPATRTLHISFVKGGSTYYAPYFPIDVTPESHGTLLYDPGTQTMWTEPAWVTSGFTAKVRMDGDADVAEAMTDGLSQGFSSRPFVDDSAGRIRTLAMQVLANAGVQLGSEGRVARGDWASCRAAGEAFVRYLQSGEFMYTLDLSDVVHRRGDDPVFQFLLETKRGHCEYFAAAMTAMCHTVGVPARIVTGYAAVEYDETSQQYEVYESNAHAWVEVLTGRSLWTTFDPTPPAVLMQPARDEGSLAGTVRSLYERLEGNWTMHIATFDSGAQDRLAESFNFGWGQKLTAALDAVRDWMERVNMFFNVGPGGYIWMGIVACALLIAVVALIKLMRRSRRIRRATGLQHVRGAEYRRLIQQLGFYIDMLAVLRRAGLGKPEWQPPQAFARVVAARNDGAANAMRGVCELFYRARFGGQPLQRADLDRAQELVSEMAAFLGVRR